MSCSHVACHSTNTVLLPRQEAVDAADVVDVALGAPKAAAMLLGATAASAASAVPRPPPLPPALEAVHSAIHSGVVAGFQLASAAGPLCDEPLWGVAFELEVRVHTATAASSSTGGGHHSSNGSGHGSGNGSGTAVLDLQEDVYGPFSGQVSVVFAVAASAAAPGLARKGWGVSQQLFVVVGPPTIRERWPRSSMSPRDGALSEPAAVALWQCRVAAKSTLLHYNIAAVLPGGIAPFIWFTIMSSYARC
jgi:hypothetical protein